ncbi:MAG TPA: GAP family protein [Mycobacterium sp.]|nr:GAP family protein [Mycobacterium sp.]
MWMTVLVMAIAVSLAPFRIGMTVLMLNRPKPILQLLAFLTGGFVMAATVGLVVLFLFRPVLSQSVHFTLPNVQIVIGVLALLMAALLLVGVLPAPKLPTRARRIVHAPSLWVAGTAGLGIALPSVDYLAVLAVIVASGAAATTQVGALLMFNVVAFALVELPLVAYLLAPARTRAFMAALNEWIRSRRRGEVAVLLGGVGCVLLAAGIAGL